MSSKRTLEFVEMSAAKRRLLDEFVQQLGLDEGVDDGDGPYPFANLPPGPAPASSLLTTPGPAPVSVPLPDPAPASSLLTAPGPAPAASLLSAPGPAPALTHPRQCMERAYPLTKSRSKQIKIGLDVATFTPFIQLQGEQKKNMFSRPFIPITPEELQVLVSDEIHSHILTALESNTSITPLIVGDLHLSLMLHTTIPNLRSVVFEHKDLSVKICLGASSWQMMKTAQDILSDRLTKIQFICTEASLNFHALLESVKQTLKIHGFDSEHSVKNLPLKKLYQLITESLQFFSSPFPEVLKQELICFHPDIIRDKLFASMKS